MKLRWIGGVVIAGALATAAAARSLEIPTKDSLQLASIAGLVALVTGAVGSFVLWATKRRGVAAQVAVASLTGLAAVGAGAAAAANEMFISSHDLKALLVILVAAGAVSVASALILGRAVARDAALLERIAMSGESTPVHADATEPTTRELAAAARELRTRFSRLQESTARERAVDASRRELIAWVSHDLRTPLAGIRAMVEALEDGVVSDDESIRRYHQTIRLEVDRLAALVDDLFELSRINAGALRLQMERVSLEDLVSDTLTATAGIARAKGVEIKGKLLGPSPHVELSTRDMMRVLRNLVENAVRHTPNDGSVWVEAGADEDFAFFSVADGCGGIPAEDLDRVFDLAFRGETARTPSNGGAGVGLAIARGIVEAHHGEIDVCNESSGCRFTVRIPVGQSVGPESS
jgi:signal transduction histidine kinase